MGDDATRACVVLEFRPKLSDLSLDEDDEDDCLILELLGFSVESP
jgi:hypothetical protein